MKNKLKNALVVMAVLLIAAIPVAADDALSWIPADAAIVGMVDVDDWSRSEATRKMFEKTSEITLDGELERFLEETGLNPREDIDTVVVAVRPDPSDRDDGTVLVVAEGRFSRGRLNAAVSKLSDELELRSIKGITYYVGEGEHFDEGDTDADLESFAVAFVSDEIVLAGTTGLVEATLSGDTRRDFLRASPLGRELSRLDRDVSAWLLADVPRAGRLGKDIADEMGDEVNFGSAFRYVSTVAIWAAERGENLVLGGLAVSSDSETLELIGDALRGMTAAWRLAVRDQKPEWIPVARSFEVRNRADSVSITGAIPIDLLHEHQEKIAQHHDHD